MSKMVFEGLVESEFSVEDGGAAMIPEIEWTSSCDENMFVRIQSWDESIFDHEKYDNDKHSYENAMLGHESIKELAGKKIRVTIEVLED